MSIKMLFQVFESLADVGDTRDWKLGQRTGGGALRMMARRRFWDHSAYFAADTRLLLLGVCD